MVNKVIRFPKRDERLRRKFLEGIEPLVESIDPEIRDPVSKYAWKLFSKNRLFSFDHKIRLPSGLTKDQTAQVEEDIHEMVEAMQLYYAERLTNLAMQAVGLYIRLCEIKTVVNRS
jgi:hypothetical protein